MKIVSLFMFFLLMGMVPLPNSKLINLEEPAGGIELCGPKEILIWVGESIVGPGWVSCDVYNEFDYENWDSNIQNAKKLMAFRRHNK